MYHQDTSYDLYFSLYQIDNIEADYVSRRKKIRDARWKAILCTSSSQINFVNICRRQRRRRSFTFCGYFFLLNKQEVIEKDWCLYKVVGMKRATFEYN